MRKLLSILVVIISGCGLLDKPTDPVVREEIREFESLYNTEINFPVHLHKKENYSKLKEDNIAKCVKAAKHSPVPKKIILSTELFEDDRPIEELVFHELGHCKFFLAHHNKEFADGLHMSIMHKEFMHEELYNRHEKYYEEELGERIDQVR